MKLSTKSRYGLRALIDLIINSKTTHVNLEEISNRLNVSKGYLEHIFSTLKKYDLVKSIKGASGGYYFNTDQYEVSVYEVLKIFEGDLYIVDYSTDDNKLKECIKSNVWDKINENIENLLKSITLKELINQLKCT